MSGAPSPLLALPAELRLAIWDALLSPGRSQKSLDAATTLTRSCACGAGPARAPGADDRARPCRCSSARFHMLGPRAGLAPQVLRVSRRVRDEALPSLYARRVFAAAAACGGGEGGGADAGDERRLEVRCSWLLLDRWLEGLGEGARRCVRAVALPMLLCGREVAAARAAFYSISSRLECLRRVQLQLCPGRLLWSGVRGGRPLDRGDEVFDWGDGERWLGPIMAFAHARIDVSAVDLLGLGDGEFGKIKTVLEIDAWRLLLPLRTTRDSRRIRRIQRALEVMEYSDVEGLREDYLTDMLSVDDNIN